MHAVQLVTFLQMYKNKAETFAPDCVSFCVPLLDLGEFYGELGVGMVIDEQREKVLEDSRCHPLSDINQWKIKSGEEKKIRNYYNVTSQRWRRACVAVGAFFSH